MVHIYDRGLTFKSWKAYAKFLELEGIALQQLVGTKTVARAFVRAIQSAKAAKIPFQVDPETQKEADEINGTSKEN